MKLRHGRTHVLLERAMASSSSSGLYHRPALVSEVQELLALIPGDRWIDATVGEGGHAIALLKATAPHGQLLGIDADPEALEHTQTRLQSFSERITLVNDNFANLERIVERHQFHPIAAIIFDLGLSSLQVDRESRGFSFREDSPLDMRLNPNQRFTAADIVNNSSSEELAHCIATFGEEPMARRIAEAIVRRRPISTALELAHVIEKAVPRRGRLHPATRTFQAIRMQVNRDLECLESALLQSVRVLMHGGRLVVIGYHSLEDRLVKLFLRRESRDCICPWEQHPCICGHKATVRVLTKKVVRPTSVETQENRRVRSARLRAAVTLVLEGTGSREQVKGGVRLS